MHYQPAYSHNSFPQLTTHKENFKVIDLAIGLQHIIQFSKSIEKIILKHTIDTDNPNALNVDPKLLGFISEDTMAPSEGSDWKDIQNVMTLDHYYNYKAIL